MEATSNPTCPKRCGEARFA